MRHDPNGKKTMNLAVNLWIDVIESLKRSPEGNHRIKDVLEHREIKRHNSRRRSIFYTRQDNKRVNSLQPLMHEGLFLHWDWNRTSGRPPLILIVVEMEKLQLFVDTGWGIGQLEVQ
jgi:hypothetical protein